MPGVTQPHGVCFTHLGLQRTASVGRGDLWEREAHAASCAEISCLNSPGLVSFLEESMDVWEADPEEAGCF